MRAGDLVGAERCYRALLKRNPGDPDALHLLGLILDARGDFTAAVESIRKAIARRGDFSLAHFNLATIFARHGDWASAEAHFRATLVQQPGHPNAMIGLADVVLKLGRTQDSADVARAAVAAHPDAAEGNVQLGNARRALGDMAQVLAAAENGLSRVPDHPTLHLHRAEACFALGRLRDGWVEYRWRFQAVAQTVRAKSYPIPVWQGEDLAGRTLLVWTEQAVGDEVMQANMFADVIAQAARCVIGCSPRVATLFRRSFPTAEIITQDPTTDEISRFDFHSSALSLGEFLRPTFDSFPTRAGYLRAVPETLARLRARYEGVAPGPQLIVGLSWRSVGVNEAAAKSVWPNGGRC